MSKHPFCDGYNAAVRREEYEDWKPDPNNWSMCPINPYEEGTEQYAEWEDGFDEGTEWLCVWQYMEEH